MAPMDSLFSLPPQSQGETSFTMEEWKALDKKGWHEAIVQWNKRRRFMQKIPQGKDDEIFIPTKLPYRKDPKDDNKMLLEIDFFMSLKG